MSDEVDPKMTFAIGLIREALRKGAIDNDWRVKAEAFLGPSDAGGIPAADAEHG